MQLKGQIAANENKTLYCYGKKIFVVDASGALIVEVNGDTDTLGKGKGLNKVDKFTEIRMFSETAQDYEIYVGFDDFIDKAIYGSVDTTEVAATDLDQFAADDMSDTDVVVIDPNLSRRDLVIKNKTGSSGTLWVTKTGAIDYGFPLDPGESITFDKYTGGAEVYSEGANTLCMLEVTY